VADRLHVNVDYDSQREFDASNTIAISYYGRAHDFLQKVEVGNVTFQAPQSHFITAAIPSGNYGIQSLMQIGGAQLRTIAAQQKGNVVRDRIFTVGDRVLQAVDRTVDDYQFEPRRFFFTVDPKLLGNYPNIDILNRQRMLLLSRALPDSVRPVRLSVYRLQIGAQPPNPNGPQFRLLGDPQSRRGQVYEFLREGIDYYVDPSLLWICLLRPLSLNNERLVVAYHIRINGVETVHPSTGGTPDLQYDPTHEQFANLLWDPSVRPGDPVFDREIRSVYRVGGPDVVRQSVAAKVVVGGAGDQEKPVSGTADTYLQLFGLAQSTNTSSFDIENRLWPRTTDPDLALGVGVFGQQIIRDQFLVLPSVRPFAANGLATQANPHNDTIYTTPAEYLTSSQRPQAIYHLKLHYQAQGNGDNGTLLLGAVQVRPNSERILVDNVPLTRGTDYSMDYDLGRVTFARPDTLFPRPRQVAVQFEENPLFTGTPTSIAGALLQIPFSNGQVNFTALSQSQQSTYTRPALGLEPQATLIGGVSASMNFDASTLARLVAKLPASDTTVHSRVTVSAEFAASKPQPGKGQQAYLESFEGGGGLTVQLGDQYWYYGSQPAAGQTLLPRIGADALDLDRATTLAWQTNVLDANGRQIRYSIQQIDPLSTLVGTGVAPPEQQLWMTLYPLSIGGLREPDGRYNWRTGNSLSGRRWRSVRTILSPSGVDVSHTENIEFWALVHTADLSRGRNPTLVFDVGDLSENSVAFSPDTAILHLRPDGGRDTTFLGRQIEGMDRLDSERDPFSRAFNTNVNDVGIPGDVADQLTVIADTLHGQIPIPHVVNRFTTCRAGYRVLYPLGDSRANCTVQNGRLDEEDIDGDNVLNYTTAQRNSEQWWRYVVDLSDNRRFNRVGRCIPANALDPAAVSGDSVCWVYFRVPFSTPDDSLNSPLLRRARSLRITMISGEGVSDTAFSQIALDQLRLTGAPWLKRNDAGLRGIAGEQPGAGFVIAGTVGTQDRNLHSGVDYQPPPGVTDQPDLKLAPLGVAPVQVNEHSLRLTAGGLQRFERAEAYNRFSAGDKNFMGYKELRVWARGIGNGWGSDGELQFFVKLGSDASDFYMYRTPLGGAAGQAGWLPEVHVDFSKLLALRAQIQNAYLHNLPRNTCTGDDSVLIANTPLPVGITEQSRYAACADGYLVYSINPGITPPNLAAVQELSVGMIRTTVGTGPRPIIATDTLELWVDDIRLGSAVNSAGFAGQAGIGITAGDVADIRASVTRRDPNFRQLGDQPTYTTDNDVNLSAAFRLDKLLPKTFGYSIPVTVNYDQSSSDPVYLSGSDIQADGISGLRTPRTAATSVTFGVKRLAPLTGGWAPLLNNLELTGSYSTGAARSEYVDGHSDDFRVTLAYNLLRALAPSLTSVMPTEVYLTTTYERGGDHRLAYLAPDGSSNASVSNGITNTLRNEGTFGLHPFPNASFRINVSSLRDLRGYGSDTLLGLIDASERDRIAGVDAGLERERVVGTQFNYSVTLLSWIRGRANMTSSYTMLHDPNTLSFVRAIDSTGTLQIPRQIGNTQTTSAGMTLDIPKLLGLPTSMFGRTRNVLKAFQPIDISIERNVLTDYEGTTAAPPISYQLGLGGIEQFRHLGGEAATSAGINTQFTIANSITLPFGATLSNRYQRITLRNWTQVVDDTNAIGDATQLIFPDIGIRWNVNVASRDAMLSNFSVSARIIGTRQFLSSPGEPGIGSGDNGEMRVRNYPVSMTAVWAGARPLTTTLGLNFTQRVDNRPGLAGTGSNLDLHADVSRAFALPAEWHARSDVRTRLSFEDSHGQSYVLNPMAVGLQSQLSNNGRRAATFSTDTDMAENLSSSLVISRVANFDNNFNRLFTQTVVSAVFHMQFYAGEMR
jgi:cell surface protein SprA